MSIRSDAADHHHHHHQPLVRYLLHLLTDEETERLDELSICDGIVAWRLRVVEDDLVDDYVGGRLSGEVLAAFESFYLSSKRRRQRVQLARSFLGAIDRASRSSHTSQAPA